jgi:hypothetical protein
MTHMKLYHARCEANPQWSPCRCLLISTRECSMVAGFWRVSNDRPWLFDRCHTQTHILLSLTSSLSTKNSSSNPRWIEYREQWASSMILWRSSKSFRTTRRSLNHRTPSASCQKHWASPNSDLRRRWLIPTSVLWAVMTSFLMVGMRAMLFSLPCGIMWRLDSSGSQQEEWDWAVRLLYWCLWLRASATTLALPG